MLQSANQYRHSEKLEHKISRRGTGITVDKRKKWEGGRARNGNSSMRALSKKRTRLPFCRKKGRKIEKKDVRKEMRSRA